MISVPDEKRPKGRRILEIAIVLSIAVHLLFGGLATFNDPILKKIIQRLIPPPKDEKKDLASLSTAITLERRTKPRDVPPVPPQPQVRPVKPQPRVEPRVAVAPRPVKQEEQPARVPLPKPTEIAKIVPHATALAAPQPVPSGDAITNAKPSKPQRKEFPVREKPVQVARIAPPSQTTPDKLSAQQVNEMTQKFAQTIAMARAANDPTRVPPQTTASTMKRAKLDIAGIDDMMRRGEGILTPRDAFRATVEGRRGMCYYVNYQIQFSDGVPDSGPVYWPICYTDRADPFANRSRGFPLPGPPADWKPDNGQMQVISQHPLLRLYFPDKFPNENNHAGASSGN